MTVSTCHVTYCFSFRHVEGMVVMVTDVEKQIFTGRKRVIRNAVVYACIIESTCLVLTCTASNIRSGSRLCMILHDDQPVLFTA